MTRHLAYTLIAVVAVLAVAYTLAAMAGCPLDDAWACLMGVR